MKFLLSKESPEEKAWKFLKTLLTEQQYDTLRFKKKPIEVSGNNGGTYFIYPNGQIARIDSEQPFTGRINYNNDMPMPDLIATLFLWITQKEKEFKHNWACGNISIFYSKSNHERNIPAVNSNQSFFIHPTGFFGTVKLSLPNDLRISGPLSELSGYVVYGTIVHGVVSEMFGLGPHTHNPFIHISAEGAHMYTPPPLEVGNHTHGR